MRPHLIARVFHLRGATATAERLLRRTSAKWERWMEEERAMPKKLEQQLKKQASEKGLKGDRKDAYVYGTLRKTGWKPSREKK